MLVAAATAPASATDYGYVATGTVVRVTDGDTFFGRIPDEGAAKSRVRLSGVQAMERGQCHAIEAQRRLHQLLPNRSAVTVKARFRNSNVPNQKEKDIPRPLRLAFNSRGEDVQYTLLREGLVLPNLMRRETLNQEMYWQAAREAAVSGVGLWDPDYCGSGPSQEAQLQLMVNYNADGNDRQNQNGKYARVLNSGTTAVSLTGWTLRTAKHAEFRFPAGTVVQPGGEVLVFQGTGRDGGGRFYWGSATGGNRQVGDSFINPEVSRYKFGGAYLVDPDNDIRAWTLYPCTSSCTNPLAGRIRMDVVYDPEGNENEDPNTETVNLTNTSTTPADLSYHVIEVGLAEVLEFPAGTVLAPGETLYVHVGQGTASRLHHYLGRDSSILPNGGSGGRAILRTHESVRVTCSAWGSTTC